jgi:hypothetical protein
VTRRTALAMPVLALASDQSTDVERFFELANAWINHLNTRTLADGTGNSVDRREIEAYLKVREAWPKAKRLADRFYGV